MANWTVSLTMEVWKWILFVIRMKLSKIRWAAGTHQSFCQEKDRVAPSPTFVYPLLSQHRALIWKKLVWEKSVDVQFFRFCSTVNICETHHLLFKRSKPNLWRLLKKAVSRNSYHCTPILQSSFLAYLSSKAETSSLWNSLCKASRTW